MLSLASRVATVWYWSDLNSELLLQSVYNADARIKLTHMLARAWRLVATALCLSEAALLLKLALAVDVAWAKAPSAVAFAAAGGAGAAIQALTPAPLAAAGRAVISRGGALGLGLLGGSASATVQGAAALGCVAASQALRMWLDAFSRLACIVLICYSAYWFAFPAETGERSEFRAQIGEGRQPRQESARTLSTIVLLRALRIARPSKRVVDLLREEERVGDPAYDPELLQRTDSSMLLWNTNANDYIVDESDGIVTGTESRCVRARLCLCAGAFYSSRHVGLAPSSRMQPSRCLASCCMPQAGGVR